MIKKYKKRILVLTILLGVVLLIAGTTYAIFKASASQTTQNDITTLNCFEVEYSDVTDVIALTNDFPIPDAEGLERTPYTFKIKNKCTQLLKVQIGVETLTTSQIQPNLIKGVITKKGETPTSAKLLSSGILGTPVNGGTNYILLEDDIYGEQEKEYDLRLWFTESMTKEQGSGKIYQGKVVVISSPIIETPRNLKEAILADHTLSEPLTSPGNEGSLENEAIIATAEDDYGTSYYFRGNIKNNFISFADKCWQIVRITGDGSIKLVLFNNNDGNLEAPCSDINPYINGYSRVNGCYDTSVNAGADYYNKTDNAYIGFMYGNVGCSDGTTKKQSDCVAAGGTWILSTSYDNAHANIKKSNYLLQLEKWYESSLIDYSNKLADVIWCNDKSVYSGQGYGIQNTTYYGAHGRLSTTDISGNNKLAKPSLICPNDNNGGKLSKFTVNDTTNGNGDLTYKVGLLTADELVFAGYVYSSESKFFNDNVYLSSLVDNSFTTMSPSYTPLFSTRMEYPYIISLNRATLGTRLIYEASSGCVVPSIALISSTKVTGNGTATNPYKVVS